MFPLLHFASSRKQTGQWRLGPKLAIAGWGSAVIITILDIVGLPDSIRTAWNILH